MRYQVLKPAVPLDPRALSLGSVDELLKHAPAVVECDLELEAVHAVRDVIPDGPAMPLPLQIGSGTTTLLGFVVDATKHYKITDEIPFVVFVRPVAENDRDRAIIRRGAAFDRMKWKMPVHEPQVTTATFHEVEVRGTDLEDAVHTHACVGRLADGRLVITTEVAGIAVSIAFKDPNLRIADTADDTPSEPTRIVAGDGIDRASIGSSFDPKPY